MNINVEVLLWNIIGDEKYDKVGLEQNVLQLYDTLWNVIGVNKSDWGVK